MWFWILSEKDSEFLKKHLFIWFLQILNVCEVRSLSFCWIIRRLAVQKSASCHIKRFMQHFYLRKNQFIWPLTSTEPVRGNTDVREQKTSSIIVWFLKHKPDGFLRGFYLYSFNLKLHLLVSWSDFKFPLEASSSQSSAPVWPFCFYAFKNVLINLNVCVLFEFHLFSSNQVKSHLVWSSFSQIKVIFSSQSLNYSNQDFFSF